MSKKLTLRTLSFNDDSQVLDYKDLLCLLLQTSLDKEGFTANEVVARTTLQNRIIESDEAIELTDHECLQLMAIVESYKWGSATLQLVEFIKDVRALGEGLEAKSESLIITPGNNTVH